MFIFKIHRTQSTGVLNSWMNEDGSSMLNIAFFLEK